MSSGRSDRADGQRPFRLRNTLWAVVAVALWAPAPASAFDAAIEDMYTQISISPPTTNLVVVCHGFGCRFRTAVGLSNADHSKLKQMFASAKKTPEAERKAIATATSWFDRRIGPEAGTTRRVAYAGVRSDQGPEQMDCIDMSRNNTSLLLLLDQLGLLKHHKVESPRARGNLLDNRWPHATAVLRETTSGRQWAVDNWTHKFGEGPDVKPLDEWLKDGY